MGKSWDESNYYIGKDNMSLDRIKEIFDFFIGKFDEYYGKENSAKFELIMSRSDKLKESKVELEMIDKNTILGEANFDNSQKTNIRFFDLPLYKPVAYKRITKSIIKVTRSITSYFLTQKEFKNKDFGPSLKKLNDQLSGTDDDYNLKIKNSVIGAIALEYGQTKHDSEFFKVLISKSVELFGARHEWLLRLLFTFVDRNPLLFLRCIPSISPFIDMNRDDFDRFFFLSSLLSAKTMPVHIAIERTDIELLTILASYFSFDCNHLINIHRFGPIEFFSIVNPFTPPVLMIYPNHRDFFGVVEEEITGDNFMEKDFRCVSFKSNSSRFEEIYNIDKCNFERMAYVCSASFNQLTGIDPLNSSITYLIDETQTNPICYFPEKSIIKIKPIFGSKFSIMNSKDDEERETREQLSEGEEFVNLEELVTFNYLNASLDLILSKGWIIKPKESVKFFIRNIKTPGHFQSFCLRSRYLRVGLVLGAATYQADYDCTLIHLFNSGTKEIDTGNRFLTLVVCKNFKDLELKAVDQEQFIKMCVATNIEDLDAEEIKNFSFDRSQNGRYDFSYRNVKFQIKNKEKKQKVKQVTAKTDDNGVVQEVRCAKRKANIEEASKETQEPDLVPVSQSEDEVPPVIQEFLRLKHKKIN